MDKLLSVKEVSELLDIKASTIYQWTHQKKIPFVKLGRFVRFERDVIAKWLEVNRQRVLDHQRLVRDLYH